MSFVAYPNDRTKSVYAPHYCKESISNLSSFAFKKRSFFWHYSSILWMLIHTKSNVLSVHEQPKHWAWWGIPVFLGGHDCLNAKCSMYVQSPMSLSIGLQQWMPLSCGYQSQWAFLTKTHHSDLNPKNRISGAIFGNDIPAYEHFYLNCRKTWRSDNEQSSLLYSTLTSLQYATTLSKSCYN